MSKIVELKKRDTLPDILRGFAIVLVVLGHCIQEGNGAEFSNNMLYFDDKLYQFIYSFHMPLFALIAGYYAYNSISRMGNWDSRLRLLGKRVSTYLIPIVVWTLWEYTRECIINVRLGYRTYNASEYITGFIPRVINNHWFLWSMIICFVIVWFMHYVLNDNVVVYAIGYVALFFIPDGFNLHAYKYLMPFYILAFYFNKNGWVRKVKISNDKLLILSAIIFIGLFLIYRREAFIYVSGYRITKNIWWKMLIIDIYRTTIGFAGCIFFISLWRKIVSLTKNYTFPVLRAFGSNSLGVYLISGYVTILGMRRITDTMGPSLPRVLIATVIIGAIALAVSFALAKIPVVKKIVGK